MTDLAGDASAPFVSEGFAPGTRVLTPAGWCAVACLSTGEEIMGCDGEWAQICEIHRAEQASGRDSRDPSFWPLRVPAMALGNPQDLLLLPEQRLLIGDHGQPVLIPAAALDGFAGITRQAPDSPEAVVVLVFAEETLILGEGRLGYCCPAPAGVALLQGGLLSLNGYAVATPDLAAARALIAARAGQVAAPPAGQDAPARGFFHAALRALSP